MKHKKNVCLTLSKYWLWSWELTSDSYDFFDLGASHCNSLPFDSPGGDF